MGGLVSGVGSLLGGSTNNSGFQAQGANILQPTTVDQANAAYAQSQNALAQQQQLAQALAGQNGIGNQSSVFNQLQGVANGTGPNPAAAQLAQATGANTANQAALMAGQRGAGANVGLLARQAAQQGAANQQNAIGQAATLQANQSLGALGQLGGIAGQQVAQQQSAVGGLNSVAQGEQGQILGGIQAQNNANVGMQSNQNSTNASMASTNANNSAGAIGGLFNGAGSLAATNGLLGSGAQKAALAGVGFALGGVVENPKVAQVPSKDRFTGALAPHIQHMAEIYHPDKFAGGGRVNAMVSPGEMYLPPQKAEAVAEGRANPMKEGKKVPGKAEVKGNSLKNDVVPAKLEEGGIVVPRTVMQSKDPVSAVAKFVEAHIKKHGSGDEHGDFKEALKKAISNRKSN